jgi:hypothetical protein
VTPQLQTTALGQHAERLYAALRALGPGWHARPEIASKIGKRRLQPWDVAALDLLIMQGRIECERHEVDAPIPVRNEYRVREQ